MDRAVGSHRSVAEDGSMTCRWVIPYQKTGKVSLVNFGDDPVSASLAVKTGDWTWDETQCTFTQVGAGNIR